MGPGFIRWLKIMFNGPINWEKSALMPIDPIGNQIFSEMPQLVVVEKMKYLGIYLTKRP